MHRVLPWLALPLVFPLFGVAAPVPKEKPEAKLKRLFGEVADARKGYDFTLDGEKLVVTVSAGAAEGMEERPPRVEREVSGDFEVRVVLTFAPPSRNGRKNRLSPTVSVGLGVWAEEAVIFRGPLYSPAVGIDKNDDGWGLGEFAFVRPPDRVKGTSSTVLPRLFQQYERRHLMFRREGGEYKYGESDDGKEWVVVTEWPARCDLPDSVRVGLFVQNTTAAECTATFSDFIVTPPKAEKKPTR